MAEYIDREKLLDELSESASYHAENGREYQLLLRDRNIVKEQKEVKAIPLDKVKQAREEIQKLVDMLSDDTVADLNMKSGIGMALEKIDKLIAESEE